MSPNEQVALVFTALGIATLIMLLIGYGNGTGPKERRKRALDADEKELKERLKAISKKIEKLQDEHPLMSWTGIGSELYNEQRDVFHQLQEIVKKKQGIAPADWFDYTPVIPIMPKEEERMSDYVRYYWDPPGSWERNTESDNIKITGLQWPVTINTQTGRMKIGCEEHILDIWECYDNQDIIEKGGRDGLKFWRKYRHALFALAGRECKEPTPKKERTYKIGDRFEYDGPSPDSYILAFVDDTTANLISLTSGKPWTNPRRVGSPACITQAELDKMTDSFKDNFTLIEES